ncbi:MAG: DUF1513 domain-containing protein [Pseudomonadota bacterium]
MATDRGLQLDRRRFLQSAGTVFATSLWPSRAEALDASEALFAAAIVRGDGSYGVSIFNERGQVAHEIDLPSRGHDIIANPATGDTVAFARRPGTFAAVFDRHSAKSPHLISSAQGRHFYGHGTFSTDGRLLYATENDYDNAVGKIGIYDATSGYTRLGEFDSFGIGPHEVALMPDGKTLLVANGGIETHPDYGRQKLNLTTMRSTVAKIDLTSGHLKSLHSLPASATRLSLRHCAVGADGTAYLGGQTQTGGRSQQAIIWKLTDAGDLSQFSIEPAAVAALKGYTSSIKLSHNAQRIGVTSSIGEVMVQIDLRKMRSTVRSMRTMGAIMRHGSGFSTPNKIQAAIVDNHGLTLR